MKTYKFPFFPPNSAKLNLDRVLSFIPDNDLFWSIRFFNGVGFCPFGLSMQEFEDSLINKPNGHLVSWDELKLFASKLSDTIDCLIIGAKTVEIFKGIDVKKQNFCKCDCVIDGFDSTDWSVRFDNKKMADCFDKNFKKWKAQFMGSGRKWGQDTLFKSS